MSDSDSKNIFHIIGNRSDTVYGKYTHYDYIRPIYRDGEEAAVIVADKDDKNCGVDHPFPEIPHINALYVKEKFRRQGLGTQLVEKMCQDLHTEKIMVDCEEKVKPFYNQLSIETNYLRPHKDFDS